MALVIRPKIAQKIAGADHGSVSQAEVEQCFENHCGGYCVDLRPEHQQRDPTIPTMWFVGETNKRRKLKITFFRLGGDIILKSAYPAEPEIERIYNKYKS